MHVQVPTNVVRNEDMHIGNGEFVLYVRLCLLYFKNYKNQELKVDHKKLMVNVGISDTRTLKKRLGKLYEAKLINNKIDKLPRRGKVTIEFNSDVLDKSKHFTMMNVKLFDMMDQLDEHCLRLVFYYKSHINLKDKRKVRYCYVGVDTLKERLKMGSDTISNANKKLKKLKLINIEKHQLKHDFEYDEDDELVYDRYNHHYTVHHDLF